MAYSVLPTWPLILFGILEPFACTVGFITAWQDPESYYSRQTPHPMAVLVPQAHALTLQLGNVLLLLAFMAVICTWTLHSDIPKKYLLVVAMADLGHIYSVYAGMGPLHFWDLGSWNSMTWGNVGFSAFLCVNRLATLLGLFGRTDGRNVGVGKKVA